KNVYYLAANIERDKFRLDVKYQSDTTGVYISYIPEPQVKNQTLIKLLNAEITIKVDRGTGNYTYAITGPAGYTVPSTAIPQVSGRYEAKVNNITTAGAYTVTVTDINASAGWEGRSLWQIWGRQQKKIDCLPTTNLQLTLNLIP
ncbi:MAG: hypothetical protein ACFNP8_05950, partial [Alloprevotella sp.]